MLVEFILGFLSRSTLRFSIDLAQARSIGDGIWHGFSYFPIVTPDLIRGLESILDSRFRGNDEMLRKMF